MSTSDKVKLRNKKTGKIKEFDVLGCFMLSDDFPSLYTEDKTYNSLAEFNEEWEDCKEPLIKDEKVRKAVRAWADVVGTNKCTYDRFWETLRSMDTSISFAGVYKFELEDENNYTIAELCGEEEE